jgi:hypothetical protein
VSRHAEEAERLAARGLDGDYIDAELRDRLVAVAQVHATLAVAEQLEAIHTLLNNSGAMA